MKPDCKKNSENCFSKTSPPKLIMYKGICMFDSFLSIADSVENFEVRDDDIWVCSYPRTGTTWTQEMVWAIANDLDFDGAKVSLIERFPLFDATGSAPETSMMNEKLNSQLNSVEYTANLISPRFIKTHLPFSLLPRQLREGKKNVKIVYVTRNPKDTCISNYYYRKLVRKCNDTFENVCRQFLKDNYFYAPFWNHINSYWERKDDPNILCIKYEDMKENHPLVIRKTASFLGKELNEIQVQDLVDHLSFSSMKKNPLINREVYVKRMRETVMKDRSKAAFIRKGEVHQWKSEMSFELIKEFDDWISDNLKKFPNLRNEFL